MKLRLVEYCSMLLPVGFLAACVFDGSAPKGGDDDDTPDSSMVDQPDAAPPDAAPDICTLWDPTVEFDPCDIPLSEREQMLPALEGSYTFTTDTGLLMSMTGTPESLTLIDDLIPGVAVLSVEEFNLPQGVTIRVLGIRPLLIVSWSNVHIDEGATVDVGSTREDGPGAGANFPDCTAAGLGGMDVEGGGGGGGGGFGYAGGDGGYGGGNKESAGTAGPAQAAGTTIRGGCPGGAGGLVPASGTRALGGDGGGAIAISARLEIDVSGLIRGGGAGGQGGALTQQNGGGGGGSGGMIWLDAPTVNLNGTAVLAANGGGGGEGSDGDEDAVSDNGDSGGDDAQSAVGGAGGGTGGNGGNGSGDSVQTGRAGDFATTGGGGGGGGGAGVVRATGDNVVRAKDAILTPPMAE